MKGLKKLREEKIIDDFFMLHNDVYTNYIKDEENLSFHVVDHIYYLNKKWRNPFFQYPLEQIQNYFGVRVSRCYAWVQYFVNNLWLMAILGLLITLYGVQRVKYFIF